MVERDLKTWFDELFSEMEPCKIMVAPQDYNDLSFAEQGHVLEAASVTMATMPLIDFDPLSYARELEQTSQYSVATCGTRGKQVFGAVRGSGGGKTRAFTEIRRELLKRDNILVLLITFNSVWSASLQGIDYWPVVDVDVYYALSVVTRMAAMFLGQNCLFIGTKIRISLLKSAAMVDYLEVLRGPEIIIGFVVWMVQRIKVYRPNVDSFILLADEVVKMVEVLSDKFGNVGDVTSVLRSALLDQDIVIPSLVPGRNDEVLKAALAISSLNVIPIGRSSSGREICPIVLPYQLNTTEIVDKIWVPSILKFRNCSGDEKHRLMLIAETVNSVPRLVQLVKDFILMNKTSEVDSNFTTDLLRHLAVKIETLYEVVPPTGHVLKAIVFNQRLRLDEPGVEEAIRTSVITNSLEKFGFNQYVNYLRISIVMLTHSTLEEIDSVGSDVHSSLTKILNVLSKGNNIIPNPRRTKNRKEDEDQGLLLEVVSLEWLTIRLVTGTLFTEGVSLCDILGLRAAALSLISSDFRPWFTEKLTRGRIVNVHRLTSDSRDHLEFVRSRLDAIPSTKQQPITLIQSGKGEAWDVGLKVTFPQRARPLYILIELKSREETKVSKAKAKYTRDHTSLTLNDFPGKGEQYNHTVKLMADRDFVYIYMRTHNVDSYSCGNCIKLGREDTFSFLGHVAELYIALRGSKS